MWTHLAVGLPLVAASLGVTLLASAETGHGESPPLVVTRATRLLVVAPHPDDETLGASGLMQHVHAAGGAVHVVFLTDGDAYRDGVRAQDHVSRPTAAEYREYGHERRREARAALDALGVGGSAATFLSFPDNGLCRLMTRYWSERAAAYRSPFTRRDRPPRTDLVVKDAEYRGEDLTEELARVLDEFRPTLIVAPRADDQHPDHCASSFFVDDAVAAVMRRWPGCRITVLNYIVHYNAWPFDLVGDRLTPPWDLAGKRAGWLQLPLTPAEVQAKRAAIREYRTQLRTLGWFLDTFVRRNEIFSRPAGPGRSLPVARNPCCEQ